MRQCAMGVREPKHLQSTHLFSPKQQGGQVCGHLIATVALREKSVPQHRAIQEVLGVQWRRVTEKR